MSNLPTPLTLTADDRFAIDQLYARLQHALDRADGPAVAECFTEDATFIGYDPSRPPIVGRATIAATVGDPTRPGGRRHWINGVLLTPRADHVHSAYYAIQLDVSGRGATIPFSTTNEDELVPQDGTWRIRWRRLRLDGGT